MWPDNANNLTKSHGGAEAANCPLAGQGPGSVSDRVQPPAADPTPPGDEELVVGAQVKPGGVKGNGFCPEAVVKPAR